jgi:hypothetical protein
MITNSQGMEFWQKKQANTKNLHELKAGDEVVMVHGEWDRSIQKVERITKAQIFVRGMAFWKDGGCEVGNKGLYSRHLDSFVEEEKQRKALAKRYMAALKGIKGIKWERQPVELLELVNSIIDGGMVRVIEYESERRIDFAK